MNQKMTPASQKSTQQIQPTILTTHQSSKPPKQTRCCSGGHLSNWHKSPMVISGQAFSSVEQYYMYSKAMLCGDSKAAMEILGTNNAAKMKQIGRRVNVEERRQGLEGCRAKFNGSAELSKRLLATGLRPIAEAGNPRTRFVGSGCCR